MTPFGSLNSGELFFLNLQPDNFFDGSLTSISLGFDSYQLIMKLSKKVN